MFSFTDVLRRFCYLSSFFWLHAAQAVCQRNPINSWLVDQCGFAPTFSTGKWKAWWKGSNGKPLLVSNRRFDSRDSSPNRITKKKKKRKGKNALGFNRSMCCCLLFDLSLFSRLPPSDKMLTLPVWPMFCLSYFSHKAWAWHMVSAWQSVESKGKAWELNPQ